MLQIPDTRNDYSVKRREVRVSPRDPPRHSVLQGTLDDGRRSEEEEVADKRDRSWDPHIAHDRSERQALSPAAVCSHKDFEWQAVTCG